MYTKCLMILKGKEDDAMNDRTKKFMLQTWKDWQKPTRKFKIPIRGYIKVVRPQGTEVTESDYIDFSADNFYIDRLGHVTGTLNFYGKAPFAKISGQFNEKYANKFMTDFTLEWVPGTEEISRLGKELEYNLEDFTGKTSFKGTLNSMQLGFSSPTITGKFGLTSSESKDKTTNFDFHLEFRDLSPYRSFFQGQESSGDVLYLNNRFMTNWVFGIQFTADKPRFMNGKPFLYKPARFLNDPECEVTKPCIQQYFQCLLSDSTTKTSEVQLSVVKKFANPND